MKQTKKRPMLKDLSPPIIVERVTKTDELIYKSVRSTFRVTWTSGWSREQRDRCIHDAYQATQAWLLEHPEASDRDLQKEANRIAEKIRRVEHRISISTFESPEAPNSDDDDNPGTAPWDDVRVRGATRATDRHREDEELMTGGASTPNCPNWKIVTSVDLVQIGARTYAVGDLNRVTDAPTQETAQILSRMQIKIKPYELSREENDFVNEYYEDVNGAKKHSARDRKRFERLIRKLMAQLTIFGLYTAAADAIRGATLRTRLEGRARAARF